ncbi:MAG: hypothetical protein WC489_06465 [Patescibacteria group bacterium]
MKSGTYQYKTIILTIFLAFSFMIVHAAVNSVYASCASSHLIGCDEDACNNGLPERECVYSCDSCGDLPPSECQVGQYSSMESCDDDDGDGSSSSSSSWPRITITPRFITPTVPHNPTPSCTTHTFAGGSIEPSLVLPGADLIIGCRYGADVDCVSITGGGLTNCTKRGYKDGVSLFACRASTNPGVYTGVNCVLSTGTAGKCCASTDVAGQYQVISTEAHFFQRMRIPPGFYTLSANVHTIISKGKGVYVDLLCASKSCGGSFIENSQITKLEFPVSADFIKKEAQVIVPITGYDIDYQVRVVAGEGSEAYVDKVSLFGGGKEYVLNGDFNTIKTSPNSISLPQPNAWTDASNKLGYYYGMTINTSLPPVPPPNSSSSSSVTGAPGATAIKLNMKIKLQGVTKKPKTTDPIYVKIKLGGNLLSETTSYQTAKFSVDDNGVWSGSAEFTVPPGNGYRVYVKGPKHIQKKVCDSIATEAKGGTYRCPDGKIQLKAGDNSVDFSQILMLAGDLPENGVQNGVIDSYDTSYIRQHLQSTNPSELSIGDLNYDGVIDGQDFSLVLAALSIKYDEE